MGNNKSALLKASTDGKLDEVRHSTPLIIASTNNRLEIVRFLINKKAEKFKCPVCIIINRH